MAASIFMEGVRTLSETLLAHPLRFLCCWQGTVRQATCRAHLHPVMELVHHPKGHGVTRFEDGTEITFEPHGTVIYPPWTRHDQRVFDEGIDICLHVEWRNPEDPVSKLFSGAFYVPPVHGGSRRADAFIHSEFAQLAKVHADPVRQAELDLRATALIVRLFQFAIPVSSDAQRTPVDLYLQRTHHYIRENHAQIQSMGEVARHAGISEDYLRHLLAQNGGGSLNQLVTQAKIVRVKELLLHSQLSIKEIATQCGFRTERYLSTRFKQLTGRSPGEFRREQRPQ